MSKKLEDKKRELERLQKEVADEEARQKHEKEVSESEQKGWYKPLATAKVRFNLYNRGERDFAEIGDPEWHTATQLLGAADFLKGAAVVLIDTGEYKAWFNVKKDGDYYGVEEDEFGMVDDSANREYLTDIVKV